MPREGVFQISEKHPKSTFFSSLATVDVPLVALHTAASKSDSRLEAKPPYPINGGRVASPSWGGTKTKTLPITPVTLASAMGWMVVLYREAGGLAAAITDGAEKAIINPKDAMASPSRPVIVSTVSKEDDHGEIRWASYLLEMFFDVPTRLRAFVRYI